MRYYSQFYLADKSLYSIYWIGRMNHADHTDACQSHIRKYPELVPVPDVVEYCIVGPDQKQYVSRLLKAAVQWGVLCYLWRNLKVSRLLHRLYNLSLVHVKLS